MTFVARPSRLCTLTSEDSAFTLQDGLVVSPRAGFKILTNCPREYKLIISECIDRGWLQPVATVYDHELSFNLLKGN